MKDKSAFSLIKFVIIGLVAVAGFPVTARAWNNIGHRTVAELAWRSLDSSERAAASKLLKEHPHYKNILAADVPAGVDTNEWVFLTAALWPDIIKHAKPGHPAKPTSITKYDLYPHAIGYPFVRPADSNYVSLKDFYIATPNAEMVLSNSIVTLNNRRASAHDRAVALCWALHLMGDLHQPLHAATWVRRDKKEWDGLGGNYIVIDPRSNKQTDMHSLWDQLGGTGNAYQSVADLADKLSKDPALKATSLPEYQRDKTIASWVQESFRYAVDFAYAEDRVQFAHIHDLHSGKVPSSAIPVLKPEYIREAEAIAHRRFVLAGQRLADELKRVW